MPRKPNPRKELTEKFKNPVKAWKRYPHQGELQLEEADQEADLQVVEEEVPLRQAEHLQERTDLTREREAE